MKMLVASPLLAQISAHELYEKSAAAVGLDTRGNVYSRLGVASFWKLQRAAQIRPGTAAIDHCLDEIGRASCRERVYGRV